MEQETEASKQRFWDVRIHGRLRGVQALVGGAIMVGSEYLPDDYIDNELVRGSIFATGGLIAINGLWKFDRYRRGAPDSQTPHSE